MSFKDDLYYVEMTEEELEKSFKKLAAGAALGAALMGSPDKAAATSGDLHAALDKVKQSWESGKAKDKSIRLSGNHGDSGHGNGSYQIDIGPYRVQGKHFSTGEVSNHKVSLLKDKKAIAGGADADGKHFADAKKMHNFLTEHGSTLNNAASGEFDYYKKYKEKKLKKSNYKGYTLADNVKRKKNNIEDAGKTGEIQAMPRQKKWGKAGDSPVNREAKEMKRKNKKQPVKVVTDPAELKAMGYNIKDETKKADKIVTYNDRGQWKLNKYGSSMNAGIGATGSIPGGGGSLSKEEAKKSNAIGDSQYQMVNKDRYDWGANDQWAPKSHKKETK